MRRKLKLRTTTKTINEINMELKGILKEMEPILSPHQVVQKLIEENEKSMCSCEIRYIPTNIGIDDNDNDDQVKKEINTELELGQQFSDSLENLENRMEIPKVTKETEKGNVTKIKQEHITTTTTTTDAIDAIVENNKMKNVVVVVNKPKKSIFDIDFDDDEEDPLSTIKAEYIKTEIQDDKLNKDHDDEDDDDNGIIGFILQQQQNLNIQNQSLQQQQQQLLLPQQEQNKLEDENLQLQQQQQQQQQLIEQAPPLFKIELFEDENCLAKQKYEIETQKIDKFHIKCLHDLYIENINGNWDHNPNTNNNFILKNMQNAENREFNIKEIIQQQQQQQYQHKIDIVPDYATIIKNSLPKCFNETTIKFMSNFQVNKEKQQQMQLKYLNQTFLGVAAYKLKENQQMKKKKKKLEIEKNEKNEISEIQEEIPKTEDHIEDMHKNIEKNEEIISSLDIQGNDAIILNSEMENVDNKIIENATNDENIIDCDLDPHYYHQNNDSSKNSSDEKNNNNNSYSNSSSDNCNNENSNRSRNSSRSKNSSRNSSCSSSSERNSSDTSLRQTQQSINMKLKQQRLLKQQQQQQEEKEEEENEINLISMENVKNNDDKCKKKRNKRKRKTCTTTTTTTGTGTDNNFKTTKHVIKRIKIAINGDIATQRQISYTEDEEEEEEADDNDETTTTTTPYSSNDGEDDDEEEEDKTKDDDDENDDDEHDYEIINAHNNNNNNDDDDDNDIDEKFRNGHLIDDDAINHNDDDDNYHEVINLNNNNQQQQQLHHHQHIKLTIKKTTRKSNSSSPSIMQQQQQQQVDKISVKEKLNTVKLKEIEIQENQEEKTTTTSTTTTTTTKAEITKKFKNMNEDEKLHAIRKMKAFKEKCENVKKRLRKRIKARQKHRNHHHSPTTSTTTTTSNDKKHKKLFFRHELYPRLHEPVIKTAFNYHDDDDDDDDVENEFKIFDDRGKLLNISSCSSSCADESDGSDFENMNTNKNYYDWENVRNKIMKELDKLTILKIDAQKTTTATTNNKDNTESDVDGEEEEEEEKGEKETQLIDEHEEEEGVEGACDEEAEETISNDENIQNNGYLMTFNNIFKNASENINNNNNNNNNNLYNINIKNEVLEEGEEENPTSLLFRLKPNEENINGIRFVNIKQQQQQQGNNNNNNQEELGQQRQPPQLEQFKEWHQVLQLRSYNNELLTVMPYVVLD